MPGDPRECRQRALNCVHLTRTARTLELRNHFAKDLKRGEALIAELDKDANWRTG